MRSRSRSEPRFFGQRSRSRPKKNRLSAPAARQKKMGFYHQKVGKLLRFFKNWKKNFNFQKRLVGAGADEKKCRLRIPEKKEKKKEGGNRPKITQRRETDQKKPMTHTSCRSESSNISLVVLDSKARHQCHTNFPEIDGLALR